MLNEKGRNLFIVLMSIIGLVVSIAQGCDDPSSCDDPEQLELLAQFCPENTIPSFNTGSSSECQGELNVNITTSDGMASGACVKAGECSMQCKTICDIAYVSADRQIICEGDGVCLPDDPPQCNGTKLRTCGLDLQFQETECSNGKECIEDINGNALCGVPCPDPRTMVRNLEGQCVCIDPTYVVKPDGLGCEPCREGAGGTACADVEGGAEAGAEAGSNLSQCENYDLRRSADRCSINGNWEEVCVGNMWQRSGECLDATIINSGSCQGRVLHSQGEQIRCNTVDDCPGDNPIDGYICSQSDGGLCKYIYVGTPNYQCIHTLEEGEFCLQSVSSCRCESGTATPISMSIQGNKVPLYMLCD